MSTVLDKLQEAETAANISANEQYHGLVKHLAEGAEDPELSAVQEILADAGKTSGDLARDLANRRRRDDLQAQVRQAQAGANERATIAAEVESANAKLRAAQEEHAATIRPLQVRIMAIDQQLNEARQLERELRASCDDAALKQRLSMNELDVRMLETKRREAAEHARRLAGALRSGFNPEMRTSREDELRAMEAKQAEMREQLAELVNEQNQLLERMVWA